MNNDISIERFRQPFRLNFDNALSEIRNGRKTSHWMWFIFPQLRGLGKSTMANEYGLVNLDEARLFLNDEELGGGLTTITTALLHLHTDNAYTIFGSPDEMKLRSCKTLFSQVAGEDNIFKKALQKFFNGEADTRTLSLLETR